uniref:Uncharacterized protein n=1 Tax=mine drainage metagenome TaxID=410659 RepID=E6QAU3_9ZZZZ
MYDADLILFQPDVNPSTELIRNRFAMPLNNLIINQINDQKIILCAHYWILRVVLRRQLRKPFNTVPR